MSEMQRDEQFIAAMLKRMAAGELPLRRQTPSPETRWSYHVGAKDPATGRIVVALGYKRLGDDFSWGAEISPEEEEDFLASDEELAAKERETTATLAKRHAALVEAAKEAVSQLGLAAAALDDYGLDVDTKRARSAEHRLRAALKEQP